MKKEVKYPDFSIWRKRGIVSARLKRFVAPEDLCVIIDGGIEKVYWTQEEAAIFENDVLKPNGWRLPTTEEWLVLANEFGKTCDSDESVYMLAERLKLSFGGYVPMASMEAYNSEESNECIVCNYGNIGAYVAKSATEELLADWCTYFFFSSRPIEGLPRCASCASPVQEAYRLRCIQYIPEVDDVDATASEAGDSKVD